MEKRSEAGKEEKKSFRAKLKHTTIVVLCILFALSTIYAVDISTYKLLNNDKDLYALRVTTEEGDKLRVDIAGSRTDVDMQNAKAALGWITDAVKALWNEIGDKLQ
jgi:hypothetical protein